MYPSLKLGVNVALLRETHECERVEDEPHYVTDEVDDGYGDVSSHHLGRML